MQYILLNYNEKHCILYYLSPNPSITLIKHTSAHSFWLVGNGAGSVTSEADILFIIMILQDIMHVF